MHVPSRTLGRLAVLLALTPALALAHGRLVSSTPGANGRLTSAPRELTLTFSEPVELAVARVRLLDANGRTLMLGRPALADGGRTLRASVSAPLPAGAYTVSWRVAGRDSHPVAGTFRFTVVGAAPAGAPGAPGAPAAGGGSAVRRAAPPSGDAAGGDGTRGAGRAR